MIITTSFRDDNNQLLKCVQSDSYMESIVSLYNFAANFILQKNTHYLWVTPEFISILERIKGFDHRVLQNAHDLIAANYRAVLCPHHEVSSLPDGFELKAYYSAAWKAYFLQEASLLGRDEMYSKNILFAVTYANSEHGYTAEKQLLELLLKRYGGQFTGY